MKFDIREFITFMALWMIPSQTPVYIILREHLSYSLLFSYLGSAILSGTIMFSIYQIIRGVKNGKKTETVG